MEDKLYKLIEQELCDWNKPSELASYNLKENIDKVYRLMKRAEDLNNYSYEALADAIYRRGWRDAMSQSNVPSKGKQT